MKKIMSVLLVVTFVGCTKPCQDLRGLESSVMVVYPFNTQTDNYIYPQYPATSPYNKDSLKVFNENGFQFQMINFVDVTDPRNPLKGFYAINIAPAFMIPDDNDAFNKEKTRKIYLKYNYNTIDTLTLVFKARKTKCDKSEYEYLKIYFRDQLIASTTSDTGIDFTLKH